MIDMIVIIISYLAASAAVVWGILLVVRHEKNMQTPFQTAAVSPQMASIFSSTSPTPSAPWWVPCDVCSSSSSLRCSRCRVPRYCSQKCQIIHWKQGHREECRLLCNDAGSCSNQKEPGIEDDHLTAEPVGNRQIPNISGPSEEAVNFEGDDGNNSETVKLSDPDVLVCPICFENLSIPIYQCKNGHILCSVCSSKIKNFCPTCNLQSEHYRCRGIEKILESAKIACPNKKYGCLMIIPWIDRHAHESACFFPPYCCPITNCGFVGTYLQLSAHVPSEHDRYIIFSHGLSFRTIFARDLGFRVLLEEKKGTVFVLRNQRRENGNVFSISVIGFERFFYEVTVKYGERFESINVPADIIQRFQVDHVPTHYLDVPDSYFNNLGEISLKIKIFAQGKRR